MVPGDYVGVMPQRHNLCNVVNMLQCCEMWQWLKYVLDNMHLSYEISIYVEIPMSFLCQLCVYCIGSMVMHLTEYTNVS